MEISDRSHDCYIMRKMYNMYTYIIGARVREGESKLSPTFRHKIGSPDKDSSSIDVERLFLCLYLW